MGMSEANPSSPSGPVLGRLWAIKQLPLEGAAETAVCSTELLLVRVIERTGRKCSENIPKL